MIRLCQLAALCLTSLVVDAQVLPDPPVVMKIGENEDTSDPVADRGLAAKHTFGPKQLTFERDGRTFANVPVRVILGEKQEVSVEFGEREVALPLTTEQLPATVAVVSRFKDGSEKPGAFLRNPTDEYLHDPYNQRVAKIVFWEGVGFYVRMSGGMQWRCTSGSAVIIDGKVYKPDPPKPTIEPGYAAPEPMNGTLEASVDYRLDTLEVTTLTPVFSWTAFGQHTAEYYIWINDSPAGQVCSAESLSAETRRCAVPEGALKPGQTYQLGVSAASLSSVTFRMVQFKTASAEALVGGAIQYDINQGNIESPW
jgi:hypothetical protein